MCIAVKKTEIYLTNANSLIEEKSKLINDAFIQNTIN